MGPLPQDQIIQIWILASILGVIPGFIAYRKGRRFGLWWIYGSMAFIVALIHSLVLKPAVKQAEVVPAPIPQIVEPTLPEGTMQCSACGQLVAIHSVRCPVCKNLQPALES